MKPKAIFIDFYGTICGGDRAAVERACENIVESFDLPLTAAEFAIEWGTAFFPLLETCNHNDFRTLHEIEMTSLHGVLSPRVGDFDPAPFVQVLEDYWSSPPAYEDAVEFLDQADVPVCVVSNADTVHLERAIGRLSLRPDAVVSSEHARSYKPDGAIFEKAMSTLGVGAEEVIHIGDSLHSDIDGAGQAGIRSVWIHRDDRIHDVGTATPDHTVRSLTEVAGLFR